MMMISPQVSAPGGMIILNLSPANLQGSRLAQAAVDLWPLIADH
jgi:hypothetical protein